MLSFGYVMLFLGVPTGTMLPYETRHAAYPFKDDGGPWERRLYGRGRPTRTAKTAHKNVDGWRHSMRAATTMAHKKGDVYGREWQRLSATMAHQNATFTGDKSTRAPTFTGDDVYGHQRHTRTVRFTENNGPQEWQRLRRPIRTVVFTRNDGPRERRRLSATTDHEKRRSISTTTAHENANV